ncbi:uncharacterized protein J3D65DRAFT_657066 [Phyllosticta citribraziliensis]|uniref:Uncharacterized protein n=1 Tax=Phyllosticta citribraziliensis TaxID=989973 RepID=A0ABR1LW86_9PEZI
MEGIGMSLWMHEVRIPGHGVPVFCLSADLNTPLPRPFDAKDGCGAANSPVWYHRAHCMQTCVLLPGYLLHSNAMTPIPQPLSFGDSLSIAELVVSFVGVVLAFGFAYASLRLQKQARRRSELDKVGWAVTFRLDRSWG